MREIVTILGSIKASELGFCQCHEHILLSKGTSFKINSALCFDNIQKSTAELINYKRAGGCSIVDAQPIGCNRMTEELAIISKSSGVNIISSTGFHKLIFYPENHWIHRLDVNELESIFISELSKGMFIGTEQHFPNRQCTFQAGIVKSALDKEGLSPRYKILFHAAATAAEKLDRPLMIHVEQGANPLLLLDFLLNLGIKSNRLIFCHLDRACQNINIHYEIAALGAYLEYDTIGRFKYHSDAYEVNLISQLLQHGYEKQLLLSLDTTRGRMKSYTHGAIGMDYILNSFIPFMHAKGISADQTQLFTIYNPVDLFL